MSTGAKTTPVSEFRGNFADYLREAGVPDDITLTIGGKKVLLPVPTKKQLREYYAVLDDETLTVTERSDRSWAAVLGDEYERVMDHFEAQPFAEWTRFSTFVNTVWFGRGADEVEGK